MNALKQLLDSMTADQSARTIKKLKKLKIPYQLDGTVFKYDPIYQKQFLKIQQDVLQEMTGLRLSDEAIKAMFN